jgi:hypothetical protein
MNVAGIDYEDDDCELFPNGSVHDATLLHDAVIQGLHCAGGRSVVFYPSGRIKIAWLSAPLIVHGIPCAAGVVTYFHENGRVLNARLPMGSRIGETELPGGTRVTLDDAGLLLEYSEQLERDAVLGGLPCDADIEIWRYPDGRPSLVVLASAFALGGQVYPRGTELHLSPDGEVVHSVALNLEPGRRYKQRVFGVYEASWA